MSLHPDFLTSPYAPLIPEQRRHGDEKLADMMGWLESQQKRSGQGHEATGTDTDLASGEGVARTVKDCSCGTSGILTLTKDRIQQINPQAKVFLYGQKLDPQTLAIARSDMLILEPEGEDAENIKVGSTLSVCLGFLAKNKHDGKRRDRRKHTLFIDACKLSKSPKQLNQHECQHSLAA